MVSPTRGILVESYDYETLWCLFIYPLQVHDLFSEESAWRYFNDMLGSEPRVAGTPYHLNKTRDVKAIVDSIAHQGNQPVWTDWQRSSGK